MTPGCRFAGKVAVVTGGSSGIGLATCRRLHDEGARVVMAARRADVGEVAASAFASERVYFQATDVTLRRELDRLYGIAVERFGRLDVVVNNAGSMLFRPLGRLSAERWQESIAVNLTAVFESCQAALPHLQATIAADRAGGTAVVPAGGAAIVPAGSAAIVNSGGAAIVNVASISGVAGDRGMAAYNAAKAGVLNFTRSLALELAPQRIRVNSVSPGAVDTPLAAATAQVPAIAAVFDKTIPLGRFGRPEEIAAAIAFLAADEASFVTGANLLVDGGVSAGTGHPDLMELFYK